MACCGCAVILARRCSAGTRSGRGIPARWGPARANNELTCGGDEMARLPSITSKDQVAAKDRDSFDSIVASRGAVQGPFTMFLHSPEVAITAIRDNHSRGVRPEDAQIIDFTRQLLRRHRVDDATFKAMQSRFGNDELVQLTTAIGYYTLLSMTVNACELEPASGAEVLKV